MPKYKVLAKSFINNSIVEEGDIVDYDGKPGSNLELVEGDKPKARGGKKGNEAEGSSAEEKGGE